MIHARIDNVIFGAQEPRAGALVSHPSLLDAEYYNHQLSFLGGVLESDCAALMQSFFKARRNRK
jgi:tRNA(adenine34) deaminase